MISSWETRKYKFNYCFQTEGGVQFYVQCTICQFPSLWLVSVQGVIALEFKLELLVALKIYYSYQTKDLFAILLLQRNFVRSEIFSMNYACHSIFIRFCIKNFLHPVAKYTFSNIGVFVYHYFYSMFNLLFWSFRQCLKSSVQFFQKLGLRGQSQNSY